MMIVLSAFVNVVENKIPLTLVLIILFYIIDEVMNLRKKDNIAHYGHVTGAICGAVFGFICLKGDFLQVIQDFFRNLVK